MSTHIKTSQKGLGSSICLCQTYDVRVEYHSAGAAHEPWSIQRSRCRCRCAIGTERSYPTSVVSAPALSRRFQINLLFGDAGQLLVGCLLLLQRRGEELAERLLTEFV